MMDDQTLEQRDDSPITEIRTKVINRVRRMTRVPLMSESTTRLLEISRLSAEDVNISELDRLIGRDPALATRILRVANSPYYAMRSTINTVRQAILVIGLSDLFSLLMVTSLMDKFEGDGGPQGLDPNQFWLHSVAVGSAARGAQPFCSASMLSPAEINLAGLLHDIGRSVFIRHFPKEFDACIRKVQRKGVFLQDAEEEILGISHAEAGGMLAQGWNLPEFIHQVIRFHHKPEEAEEVYQDAARLVGWCDGFALEEHLGESGNIAGLQLEEGESRIIDLCVGSRSKILQAVKAHFQNLQIELEIESEGHETEEITEAQVESPASPAAPDQAASSEAPSKPSPQPQVPKPKPTFMDRVKGWFR